jgi:hypothetical protein
MSTPQFIIRQHDPAQRRRTRLLFGALWLVSIALAVVATYFWMMREVPAGDDRASLAHAAEVSALKSQIAVLERSEQVAKAALVDLQRTLRDREEEIAGVRADLAFYGRLVGGAKREGLAVHALSLQPIADSRAWNFSATLTQNFKRGPETRGRLTVSVSGIADGKLETLNWSRLSQQPANNGIDYSFKYFQQVNGTIMLPEGFEPNRVRVSAEGEGGRAEQEFPWNEAIKAAETENVRQ